MNVALRASLFDFIADPLHTASALRHVQDGLLLIENGGITARGDYADLRGRLAPSTQLLDYSGCLITPGFVDTHIHLPQVDVIASPAPGLLEWLERHTFPVEARFSDAAVS